MMNLNGPRLQPADGGSPRALVIFIHGYGADGNDLIEIGRAWSPGLPHVAFVSPHAPFPCDMAPFGRQWFSLANRTDEAMLAGVRDATRIIDAFIDRECARHALAPDRLALVGFSQGTMLALFAGVRRRQPVAGIVGYSGRLIAPERLRHEVRSRPPVTLIHGRNDELVPAGALSQAAAALKAVGIDVASEIRPGLGHSIDQRGLQIGFDFLETVLPA